LIVFFC